jgi:hypothetical protein
MSLRRLEGESERRETTWTGPKKGSRRVQRRDADGGRIIFFSWLASESALAYLEGVSNR